MPITRTSRAGRTPASLAASEAMHPLGRIGEAQEVAHAIAWLAREAPNMQGQTVVLNLSGRGDKDVAQMMDILGDEVGGAGSASGGAS